MQKRSVDVVVVSDLHLGTYACRAKEFVAYLKSISPRLLILNGDIIDGWQFSKHYFPTVHMAVIQEIFHLLSNGTRVIYITGNHDEILRRYSDIHLGNFQLTDKVVIEINGKMIIRPKARQNFGPNWEAMAMHRCLPSTALSTS